MTTSAVKQKMCSKKRRYARFDHAAHAAIQVSRKFGPMRIYKCPFCKGYHLTSRVEDYT